MAVRGGQAPVTPIKRRVWSFALLACGLVLTKFSICDPFAAAERHEPAVSFSLRNATFAVVAVILGLLLVIVSFMSPDFIVKFHHWGTNLETKRVNGKAIAATAILIVICFVVAFLVQTQIRKAGYDV